MTRCDEFYEKVRKDGDFCGMRSDVLKNVEAYITFLDDNPTIVGISEGAARLLISEKDQDTKAKALEAVGKNISHGNVPTAKQVKTILDNKRGNIEPKGHISNDLSGIYRPPARTLISKIPLDEVIVEEEENVVIEEFEDVVDEEGTSVMPNVEVDDIEGIPQMPAMAPQGDTPIVEEDKDEEIEEETKKSQAEVEVEDRERLETLKEREEQRADDEAEKIVATCLKSILRRGYPGQKLNWLVLRAVSEVLTPDSRCPMPDSGSATRGGAITTNLGGR